MLLQQNINHNDKHADLSIPINYCESRVVFRLTNIFIVI